VDPEETERQRTTRDASSSDLSPERGTPGDAEQPFRVARVEVVRGSIDLPLGWLSFGLFWFFIAIFTYQAYNPPFMRALPDMVPWAPLGLAALVGRLSVFRRHSAVLASVGPEGLQLSGRNWQKLIPRKELASACFRPALPGTEVELRLTDRSVLRLHVPEETHAVAMVRALGRDTAHRAATIGVGTEGRYKRAAWGALGHFVVLLALLLYTGALSWPVFHSSPLLLGMVALQALVSYLVIRLTRRAEVTIGLDRVVVRMPFRTHVIPWSRIARIEERPTNLGIALHPAGGVLGEKTETIWLDTGNDAAAGRALYDRLIEAQSLRERPEDAHLGKRLERGGRSFAEWRIELSRLLKAGEGYRSAAVSVEALRALAASPSASAEQRLGAALALGVAKDPDGRTAVRVSARSVVSPKLRIALREAVQAKPDEAAIEEALSEAEEEEGKKGGQSG